jgi:hypothetical protein
MKKLIRCVAGTGMLIALVAGCGSPRQDVTSPGAGGSGATANLAAATKDTTTTTAASNTVPLSEIPTVGEMSPPMSGPIKMNTVVYDDSVYQPVGCAGGFTWVFDLNRGYKKLNAVVGLDDASLANDDVTVAFTGDDGKALGQAKVSLGTVTPVEIGLTGNLRLRITVTRAGGGCIPEVGYGSTLGLGNATLTQS